MYTIKDVYDCINAFAPFDRALSYDNAGLLCGSGSMPVRGILVSLDVTCETVAEAQSVGADLIVSHHPVIFSPLRRLEAHGALWHLARAGIGAICAHTNLDAAEGGVNAALAAALGLQNVAPFCPDDPEAVGMTGVVSPTPIAEFCRQVKQRLNASFLHCTDTQGDVRRVAVIGGSGGGDWQRAAQSGFDALVTGEAKYHQFLEAAQVGFHLIAAGHYATEVVVLPTLVRLLSEAFPDLPVTASRQPDPLRVF